MSNYPVLFLYSGSPRPAQRPVGCLLRGFAAGIVSLVSLLAVTVGNAQQDSSQPFVRRPLRAMRLPEGVKPPVIDGDLADAVWQNAAKAETFLDPQTGKPTQEQTEAYLFYDKTYIYAAFRCHDSHPETIVAQETVRDADMEGDDSVRLMLDTFLTYKQEDVAMFIVNPIGTRKARLPGGRAGKVEWQGDWEASARRAADGWTAEMRIPWAILSCPHGKGATNIGLNFGRLHHRTRIDSMWSDMGPQYFRERQGIWQGVETPSHAWKPRLSFLPYLEPAGQAGGGRSHIRAGLDARYQPTSELTTVATFNPDFSSVEGAVEGIGFTRSERFVPDKRPFFLEGQDYLRLGQDYQVGSFFDSTRINQFDTGVKLYGKLDPKNTIGMLGTVSFGHQANFVTQLRHEFGPTASASLMLLQRLEPGQDNTTLAFSQNIRRGKWSFDGQVAQTAGPEAGGMAWTSAINLEDKNLFTTIRYRRVGSTFLDRLGFISFQDYRGWSSYTNWSAEWRHGYLRNFNLEFYPEFDQHLDGRPFRRRASLNVGFETRHDYAFGFNVDGGKFDNDTDFTYGVSVGGNVSNRFRRWGLNFTTGQQANRPYTSFGPTFNVRLFKKLDISVGSFVQNYNGISQQHIVTFNYNLTPFRSWGGRVVVGDNGTNFYVSYRNSGRAGTDTYLIFGDPNAKSLTNRVTLKWVFAL